MHKLTQTKPVLDAPREQKRQVAGHNVAIELCETAIVAFPMVLTQLGQIAMVTTDLAFIGRLGVESLAATALACRVYLVSLMFGVGLLAAMGSLAAQAFGADNLTILRRSLRMGLWAEFLLAFPIMAFALRGEHILLALGQAPDESRLAQEYLFGLAWGVAPALWFHAIRNFMGAVNRPEPAFWITLAAIPVNALVVYLLIYGKFGMPRLGLFGAGLGTTLVNFGTFFAGLWFATMRRPFRDYHVLAHFWRFDWSLMRQLIGLGTPISISFLMWYGLSSAATLLAGLIGTTALAAHQIALQITAVLFRISFGISMAAAARVGHAVGRNDGPGIKRAGLVAILFGVAIAAMLTVAVIAARFEIAELFLGGSSGDVDATIGLAAKLLLVGASFFVTDAVESIAAGALRGLKDTRALVLFAGVSYWVVGLSLSYVLGMKVGLGAIGIWIGLSVGKAICAALVVLRFQLLASRLAEPLCRRPKHDH